MIDQYLRQCRMGVALDSKKQLSPLVLGKRLGKLGQKSSRVECMK